MNCRSQITDLPISFSPYTANIFNLIFTLFTCVPLSTVTGQLVLQVPTNKWKVDLQFFYCNFYVGLYMANICKVCIFYMCPVSTVFSLHIFAVWHKPNKGKKRNHNMFGIIFLSLMPYPCSLFYADIKCNIRFDIRLWNSFHVKLYHKSYIW